MQTEGTMGFDQDAKPPAEKIPDTPPTEKKEEDFNIHAYQDPQYTGPDDPSEPGFIPYLDRPRPKKPVPEIIKTLETAGFTALRTFSNDDSDANNITEFGRARVGIVWRAPNGVEFLTVPAGYNVGEDDLMLIYARQEEGGKFCNAAPIGYDTVSSADIREFLRDDLVFRYNFLKQNRTVFYFGAKNKRGEGFPEDFDRTGRGI
ncbi:hypothetical protein HY732_03830 [Candidatus Uhrbacteria bacterium]|nr:hypothetical protein [Candidatus Uhrbacteria bacterium]